MSDHLVRAPRWVRLAVAALFTVIFAVVLVKSVQSDGRSLGFAFGVNWLLMAWAIVVGRLVLFRFPSNYYRLRRFEKDGRIYDRLGVRWYQRSFRRFVWSVNLSLVRSQLDGRAKVMESTYDPESGHLYIFLIITGITLRAAALGWWDSVAWLLLFNLLHNGYPVMSMRQLRARLVAGQRGSHVDFDRGGV
jgi:hypothetical protein